MKIKKAPFFVCLIFAMVAVRASACDDSFIVASVEKNLPLQKKTVALPPLVTERYEYYDVHGSCENDVLCDLRRKGITWEDGKKYESVTSWHVKWNYGYNTGTQTCSADSFQVIVDIVFRYPKWTGTEDAPRTLAEKWDYYIKKLIMHENGHRDMAVEAAAELSRAVSEMPPAQTCTELDRAVRILSRTRMNKLNDDERHYDEATNHGATQGAVFR
ncbi:MAG: DUF922 domain-containing protein [Betaproteobacteria bacterium]